MNPTTSSARSAWTFGSMTSTSTTSSQTQAPHTTDSRHHMSGDMSRDECLALARYSWERFKECDRKDAEQRLTAASARVLEINSSIAGVSDTTTRSATNPITSSARSPSTCGSITSTSITSSQTQASHTSETSTDTATTSSNSTDQLLALDWRPFLEPGLWPATTRMSALVELAELESTLISSLPSQSVPKVQSRKTESVTQVSPPSGTDSPHDSKAEKADSNK